ncbi:hypothetical protein [Rhodovulum kholense]|uniref:Uncharacterized protein n=1 Tax=Rhodovulum kholense TaxID=453584 RepID=A0A8E2VQD6_9RHOB|nr:hypothetical protein [Rhodovulum kholense]PTW52004.1 hypothetical protein C8N38_101308 [Rhodovulum kholense]
MAKGLTRAAALEVLKAIAPGEAGIDLVAWHGSPDQMRRAGKAGRGPLGCARDRTRQRGGTAWVGRWDWIWEPRGCAPC